MHRAISRIAPVSDKTKTIAGVASWLIAMAAQFGDYHNSIWAAAFAFGGAGLLVWAAVHHVQERRRTGEWAMEPSHLILSGLVGASLCLLVAAGGYFWSRVVNRAQELHSPQSTSSSTGQPRIATPQQPVKIYSRAEKDDLLNATRQIANVMETRGHEVAAHIESTLHAWGRPYNSNDKSKIPDLLDNIDQLNNVATNLRDALSFKDGTSIDQYRSYSQEIESILSLPKEWQLNPIENLIVVSDRFQKHVLIIQSATKYGNQELLRSLADLVGVSELQTAQKNFLDWISASKKRMEALRTSLP
jgi:hypothetical protein